MLKEYLSNLANQFRRILGTTEPINAQDFADKINKVKIYGWNEGMSEGYNHGLEEGKQAEYDRFWNLYQPNGNEPTGYSGAFSGNRWTMDTFTPKYDIVPSGAQNMFWNSAITDLVAACERQGIKLDFSQNSSTQWGNAFSYARSTRLGKISAEGAQFSATFSNAHAHTIEKLIVSETTSYGSAFVNCSKLQNITFEGVIGKSGLNLSYSPLLTHDSLMSVINCLKDYSSTSGYTVTLGATNLDKLTDSEKAIATQKGWTLA